MVIDDKTTQINTFSGGMNTDTSDALIDDKLYRFAKNVRFVTDTDSNTGELHLIKGVTQTYKFPVSGCTLLKATLCRDMGVLIVKNADGAWAVYKFTEEDAPLKVFGWCTDLLGDNLSVVTRYEDTDNLKLYIADGKHNTLVVDLLTEYPNGDVNLIRSIPAAYFKKPIFGGLVPGTLKAGTVQYSYQFYNKHRQQSEISPATRLIPIIKGNMSDKIKDVEGYEQDGTTDKGVKLSIPISNEASIFDHIKIYRITYVEAGQLPTIEVVYDGLIDGLIANNVVEIPDTPTTPDDTPSGLITYTISKPSGTYKSEDINDKYVYITFSKKIKSINNNAKAVKVNGGDAVSFSQYYGTAGKAGDYDIRITPVVTVKDGDTYELIFSSGFVTFEDGTSSPRITITYKIQDESVSLTPSESDDDEMYGYYTDQQISNEYLYINFSISINQYMPSLIEVYVDNLKLSSSDYTINFANGTNTRGLSFYRKTGWNDNWRIEIKKYAVAAIVSTNDALRNSSGSLVISKAYLHVSPMTVTKDKVSDFLSNAKSTHTIIVDLGIRSFYNGLDSYSNVDLLKDRNGYGPVKMGLIEEQIRRYGQVDGDGKAILRGSSGIDITSAYMLLYATDNYQNYSKRISKVRLFGINDNFIGNTTICDKEIQKVDKGDYFYWESTYTTTPFSISILNTGTDFVPLRFVALTFIDV